MDQEEQKYIDKKFAEMYDKMANPSPELIAAQRQKMYKQLLPWMIVGAIAVVGTMVISFWWLGLI
jgi:hypothetical protein